MSTSIQAAFLLALARAREPRVVNLTGNAGSSGSRRNHTCNVCGEVVATDSAKYRPTKRALAALDAHEKHHYEIFNDFNTWAQERLVELDSAMDSAPDDAKLGRISAVIARALLVAPALQKT